MEQVAKEVLLAQHERTPFIDPQSLVKPQIIPLRLGATATATTTTPLEFRDDVPRELVERKDARVRRIVVPRGMVQCAPEDRRAVSRPT